MDDATDEGAHEEREGNEQKVDAAVDPRRERWVTRGAGGDHVDGNTPDNTRDDSDRAQLLPSQCQHRTREHAENHPKQRHDDIELDAIADSPPTPSPHLPDQHENHRNQGSKSPALPTNRGSFTARGALIISIQCRDHRNILVGLSYKHQASTPIPACADQTLQPPH